MKWFKRKPKPKCKKYPNGICEWYQNGQLHRIDGPAVEWVDGTCWWYLFGQMVTEEEHGSAMAKGELYLKLRYG